MANPRVKFSTSKGDMIAELYEDQAPNTVANMISLAEKGFYTDIKFHRILKGFMAQGGCPHAQKGATSGRPGTGGPGYCIDNENASGKHDARGILSMANAGPNTNGSQFFMCFKEASFLNGGYTVFGKIVEGLPVLDAIEACGAARDPNPPTEDIYFTISLFSKDEGKTYTVKPNGKER